MVKERELVLDIRLVTFVDKSFDTKANSFSESSK
jgi:hypothetical protein